jgi:hypothetical protein
LFAITLISTAGCAQRATPSTSSTGPIPALETTSAPPIDTPTLQVTSADLYPPGPMVKVYQATDGSGRSKAVTLERREISAPLPDGSWTITFSRPAKNDTHAWDVFQLITFRTLSSGVVEMTRFEDRAENAVIEYEPPIIVAPAFLTQGTTFTSRGACVLKSSTRPDRVRDRGSVIQTVELIGPADDGGPGVRVRSILIADLSAAKVTRERDQLVTPAKGGRLERDSKIVKVGMLTWESTKRVLRWDELASNSAPN